jgi:hypothetical protein
MQAAVQGPQTELALSAAVADDVGHQFMRGEHHVAGALLGQPGQGRVGGHGGPELVQRVGGEGLFHDVRRPVDVHGGVIRRRSHAWRFRLRQLHRAVWVSGHGRQPD